MSQTDCIFCKISKGELESRKIYEDDNTVAVLDINPVSKGHTLLLLKQHEPQLFELGGELYSHYLTVAQRVARDLKKKLGAERINIKTDGSHIPDHVHIHLIPIYHSDEVSEDPHDLDELAKQLSQ